MPEITIQLDRSEADYVPGEPITGTVAWDLDRKTTSVTMRLLWQTSGKGTQDTGVVREQTWQDVSLREERDFAFDGIDGPYSFSGKLITLSWLIEALPNKGDGYAERPLTISPTGAEVRL